MTPIEKALGRLLEIIAHGRNYDKAWALGTGSYRKEALNRIIMLIVAQHLDLLQ